MASPQPTDSHTRISNELYTQILMRDFTKRQRAILDLIIRLSYGCGKKTASISHLSDFSVCGVDKHHIKPELKKLQQLGVIDWELQQHEFCLNKDYDSWQLTVPEQKQMDKMTRLVRENIKGYHNGNQQESESYHGSNPEVTTVVTQRLPEFEPKKPSIPRGSKDEAVPITKDNYIDINKERESRQPLVNKYHLQIMKYGREAFPPYGMSQAVAQDMAEMLSLEQLPIELGHEVLRIVAQMKADEGLAKNKLRRWLQSGVTTVEEALQYEESVFGSKNKPKVGDWNDKGRGNRSQDPRRSQKTRRITNGIGVY